MDLIDFIDDIMAARCRGLVLANTFKSFLLPLLSNCNVMNFNTMQTENCEVVFLFSFAVSLSIACNDLGGEHAGRLTPGKTGKKNKNNAVNPVKMPV